MGALPGVGDAVWERCLLGLVIWCVLVAGIDRLCINQVDLEEKARQVALVEVDRLVAAALAANRARSSRRQFVHIDITFKDHALHDAR